MHPCIEILADSGYQGLQKRHIKTRTPQKKTKKVPISKEDKKANSQLASERVANENVIAMVKRFKILSESLPKSSKTFWAQI